LVLFVEDEPSIFEPFSAALKREGFEPVVASTLADARAAWVSREPDIVLLDLGLPDGDGRDLCRELRASSDVPIIVLTARGTELERVLGLELGADDYVVKPFSGVEVIARMRAVLRRTRPADAAPSGVVEIGPLRIDVASRRVWLSDDELSLSRKEFDLLAELVAHAGEVVKREDLMSRVWDENWFGSTKTLDVHVRWLRGKLGDDPAEPRFLHTVRGVGFRFTGADEWAS
jgi:two-component system, OmpR family, response regulator RegX3